MSPGDRGVHIHTRSILAGDLLHIGVAPLDGNMIENKDAEMTLSGIRHDWAGAVEMAINTQGSGGHGSGCESAGAGLSSFNGWC